MVSGSCRAHPAGSLASTHQVLKDSLIWPSLDFEKAGPITSRKTFPRQPFDSDDRKQSAEANYHSVVILRLSDWRSRSGNYLIVLSIGIVLSQFSSYIWFEKSVFKGQAPNILVTFAFFAIALILWFTEGPVHRTRGMLLWCLSALAAAWVVHFWLFQYFGDAYNYTSFLYLPMLAMLALKPPTVGAARAAVIASASTATAILIITFTLERLGIWSVKAQAAYVVSFDESNYFLPFNSLLGIDGRWPGPFGHGNDTAMIGALLIVIALAFWSKASWLFLLTGAITLIITSGRASIGAAAAGIVVFGMFSDRGPISRVPPAWRWVGGTVLLAVGALGLFVGKLGLTGRQDIWPAFIDLWKTSPLLGVGGSGIATSEGLTQQFGHAHSLYLDELARYGLTGFAVQFTALAIGVVICVKAAGRGAAGPIAVLVTYFVAGITDPRNSWISPSVIGFIVILMFVTASAELDSKQNAETLATPLTDLDSATEASDYRGNIRPTD
jgi:O-antigen ligase